MEQTREVIEGFDITDMNEMSKKMYRAFGKAMKVYHEHEMLPVQSPDRMNKRELGLFLFMAGMKHMDNDPTA